MLTHLLGGYYANMVYIFDEAWHTHTSYTVKTLISNTLKQMAKKLNALYSLFRYFCFLQF